MTKDRIPLTRKGNPRALALALVLTCVASLPLCASAEGKTITSEQTWPVNGSAQREFPARRLYIDRASKPARLWLISAPKGDIARAIEFFSGEPVDSVHVMTEGERVTFADSHGQQYANVKTSTYMVKLDDPSSNALWQKGEFGHEVVFGTLLAAGDARNGERVLSEASPGREKKYFGGQASCEPQPYVAQTRGSRYQNTEDDFVPRTKIFADFDRTRGCWTSKPLQVMDLEDNTFLLVTQDRVFRINSKDMTPAGIAPDLKMVDVPTGDLSVTYYTCVNASGGVTAAINDCIGNEHDMQDKRLNAVYQRLRASLSPELRSALRDEERTWIGWRDGHCAPKKGGTGDLLDSNQCLLDQTARRASLLEARMAR